jgi:hypothetical protein
MEAIAFDWLQQHKQETQTRDLEEKLATAAG